jgi:hypothetical protein
MRNNTSLRIVGLTILLIAFVLATVQAQESAGPPDVTPAPRPELPQQYYPRFTYGPLEAAEEARRRGEEAGRDAINRQLQLADDIRWMNTWIPTPNRPSLPYIYGYGVPRVARRAIERWADPVFTPWPRVPGDIYGYPYYSPVKQPIGHEKIWTSPNSYVYRPKYAPSTTQPTRPTAPAPTPARPRMPPAAPPSTTAPVEPEVLPPGIPEPIPVPPIPQGPREF